MADMRHSYPAGGLEELARASASAGTVSPAHTPSKGVKFDPALSPQPPDTGELSRNASGNSTGSGTSGESPPPSDTAVMRLRQLTALTEDKWALEEEVARLTGRTHMVESRVDPHDLAPTDVDLRAGFTDWRDCPVNGAHLKDGGHKAQGAQGAVLRALWKSSIPVAIKENLNDNSSWDDDLTTEMKLFLELHHPHVVACYGILKEEKKNADGTVVRTKTAATTSATGTPQSARAIPAVRNSIVTEACRTSLEHYLKKHSNWAGLDPDIVDRRKYTILLHVSLGLQKLHDMGVLHRDIKAGNLLLDGAAGVCGDCQRQGTWKICDFGEAKVLQSPEINFMPAEKLPEGCTKHLVADGRFQKITSPHLQSHGARWYCWLLPGEELPIEFGDDADWIPCPHGGFVYLFSDDKTVSHPNDCYFDVRADATGIARTDTSFPQALGPFSLIETELRPRLDLTNFTYKLRDRKHRNPELQKLKGFGVRVEGTISPASKITLPREAKRKLLIPQEATHFVWAYQGVDLEELTQEQAATLNTENAEINFAKLGGYVYIEVPTDDAGEPDFVNSAVVGANAIALAGTTCRTGTIDREAGDDAVTASIASPEMLEGAGIGLETDIYGFGIVMWETLTRQEAWHWLKGGKDKDMAIMNQVLLEGRRPKAPPGLEQLPADWMRRCLHTQPELRPTAKELTEFFDDMQRRLDVAVEAERLRKVREVGAQTIIDKGWWLTRRKDEPTKVHWSATGRYSVHPSLSKITPAATTFVLVVKEVSIDQWMENALVGDEPAPLGELDKLPNAPKEAFGLVFKCRNKRGEMEDHWPRVARVDLKDKNGRPTIASQFPDVQVGCSITMINGEVVPGTFKDAQPMLKKLPLELEFSAPAGQTDYSVPAWLRAGLEEIGLVKLHESRPRGPVHHQHHMAMHGRSVGEEDSDHSHLEHAEHALGYSHAVHCPTVHCPDGCPVKKDIANGLVRSLSVGQARLVRNLSRESEDDEVQILRKKVAHLEKENQQLKFQNKQLIAQGVKLSAK
jgi:serine/threonine protein kinase